MIAYICTFFITFLLDFVRSKSSIISVLPFLFLIIFLGCRSEIGGDWDSYYEMYQLGGSLNIFRPDPIFYSIIWIFNKLSLDFTIFILVTSCFYVFSLFTFCKSKNISYESVLALSLWLLLLLPIGFIKQSLAVSFLFLFLAKNDSFSLKNYFLLILGVGVHSAMIVVIPLLIIALIRQRENILLGCISILALGFILIENFDLISMYFNKTSHLLDPVSAYGAHFRLSYLGVIGMIALTDIFSRMNYSEVDYPRRIEIVGLIFILFLWAAEFAISSMVVDRVSFFILPLVLGAMGTVEQKTRQISFCGNVRFGARFTSILAVMGISLSLCWLLVGDHSKFFLPYEFKVPRMNSD